MANTGIFLLILLALDSSAAIDLLVVTSTDEPPGEPAVLEIFDFASRRWRAVEKSSALMSTVSLPPSSLRARDDSSSSSSVPLPRPGTARLVEDHKVLQYELRDGAALELASYPRSIGGSATLEYGDTFCLVGGFDEAKRTLRKSVICWNPLTPRKNSSSNNNSGGWVALPDMTSGRHLPGAVVMDGKLYVAGGYDTDTHTFLDTVEVFDDVSQGWYPVASLKHPRAGLQLVALSGKLYALGGWRKREFTAVVEVFDPLTNTWNAIKKMMTPRAKFGTVVRDGKIYAVGGMKGFHPRKDLLSSVEVFSPEKDEWYQMNEGMRIIRGPVTATLVRDP